jgi:hypothetical protein
VDAAVALAAVSPLRAGASCGRSAGGAVGRWATGGGAGGGLRRAASAASDRPLALRPLSGIGAGSGSNT